MKDYQTLFELLYPIVMALYAWCIDLYLRHRKRIFAKREDLGKQTKMMLQTAKDWERLRVLIESEIEQKKLEDIELDQEIANSQQALSAVEKICSKIPYQIVIDAKAAICQENHIQMNYHKEVENENRLDGLDMVTVVGNLLDNAIESCITQKSAPKIWISLKQKMNLLELVVSNTRKSKKKKSGHSYSTTKQDKLLHGYGLKNVQDIVKKHNGEMEISEEGDLFTVCIRMECER